MQAILSYTVYFGADSAAELTNCGFVIMQPDALTIEKLTILKDYGALIGAYLIVGEVEPDFNETVFTPTQ
jgi:hypothetical protein